MKSHSELKPYYVINVCCWCVDEYSTWNLSKTKEINGFPSERKRQMVLISRTWKARTRCNNCLIGYLQSNWTPRKAPYGNNKRSNHIENTGCSAPHMTIVRRLYQIENPQKINIINDHVAPLYQYYLARNSTFPLHHTGEITTT